MPSNSVPIASPDLGFIPRKEFIREQTISNTFSLLAISGSNAIRLYSFPIPVISGLRHIFDQRINVTAFREDTIHNLCEFSLEGKPWTSPKNVNTEKLLVDILAVIFQHGYTFLSSIDYGREPDDRLAMAFAKPSAYQDPPRSGSPFGSSLKVDGSASCISQLPKNKKVPFALSFPSGTMLRVIDPPLHSTPAILAAVRGAWPRGVVSEKKVGDASFEFKLKGYKWFQEDTFATDSLRHILSLLSSLDTHSFSLLASLSLSNRSRVKDLWIFTGPAPSSGDQELPIPDSPAASVKNLPNADFRAVQGTSPEPGSQSQHKRAATVPYLPQPSSHTQTAEHHTRAVTENGAPYVSHTNHNYTNLVTPSSPLNGTSNNRSGGLLRKPAPRAQVPVSVIHDNDERDQRRGEPGLRAVLPSTVSSDIDNMTGVGAAGRVFKREPGHADVLYESPGDTGSSSSPMPMSDGTRPRSTSPLSRQNPLHPVSHRPKTPPLVASQSPSPTPSSGHAPPTTLPTFVAPHPQPMCSGVTGIPALLGPGVFRDSAFSSSTEASVEIPIKWTGGVRMEADENQEKRRKHSEERASAAGHVLPGGWAPTPVEEVPEEHAVSLAKPDAHRGLNLDQHKEPGPVRDVASRVDSPELRAADERPRKSEAGVVGMIPPPPRSPSTPLLPQKHEGWVLVNVEGKKCPEEQCSENEHAIVRSPGVVRENGSANRRNIDKTSVEQVTMPAAKAIVMIDALDAKAKAKPGSGSDVIEEKGASAKNLFSMNRKTPGVDSKNVNNNNTGSDKAKTKAQGGFREKLKRLGITEASRAVDKRRSIN